MPDPPTSGVNGQVLSVPALQASMSMLSFAPAATMSGSIGLMATVGSFCLFCENGVVGLPTVTNGSRWRLPDAWRLAEAGLPRPTIARARITAERATAALRIKLLLSGDEESLSMRGEGQCPYRRHSRSVKPAPVM